MSATRAWLVLPDQLSIRIFLETGIVNGLRDRLGGDLVVVFLVPREDAADWAGRLDELGYLDHGTLHWDEEAKSTYRVYDGDGFVPEGDPGRYAAGFLSYEDERSIAAKGQWVRETGVGGTIIWMIGYGWVERLQQNPLLDAVKESFLE